MAIINFNAAEVTPDAGRGDPIPEGWYNLMVDESEIKPTTNNATTGNAYLVLRFTVMDGANKGRKIFSNFNIKNDNPTAQEIAYKQLSAVAHAVGVLMVQDSQQLHGIPLKGRVKIKKGGLKDANNPQGEKYDDSNEITMYKNINEPTPEIAVSKPAVAAPAMGAFPAAAAAAAPNPAQWAPSAAAPAAAPPAAVAPPTFAPQPWANGTAQAPAPAATAPAAPAALLNIPVFVPPAPAAPVRNMLPAANGVSYDAYIAAGWTDDALVQNGMMAAPVASAPAAPVAPPAPPTPPAPSAAPAAPAAPAPGAVAAQGAVPPWARTA